MRVKVTAQTGERILDVTVHESLIASVEVKSGDGTGLWFVDNGAYNAPGIFTKTWWARRRERRVRDRFRREAAEAARIEDERREAELAKELEKFPTKEQLIRSTYEERDKSLDDFGYRAFYELFGQKPNGHCYWPECNELGGRAWRPGLDHVGDEYFCNAHCLACDI